MTVNANPKPINTSDRPVVRNV